MKLRPSARHPRLSAAAPARPYSPSARAPFAQLTAHQIRHAAPSCSATKRTQSAPTSTIPDTHAIPAPASRVTTPAPSANPFAQQIRHAAPPYSATKRTPSAPTSTIPNTHAIQAPAPRLAQSSLALKSQVPQGGAR